MNYHLVIKEKKYGAQWMRLSVDKQTIRLLIIMKTILLLILLFSFQASAKLFAQSVSISLRNVSISVAMNEISKQTSYDFAYNKSILKSAKPVTLTLQNETLEESLKQLFFDQPFTYAIKDKIIIIKEKSVSKTNNRNLIEEEQQESIRGRVTNESGERLAGATIRIKGTNVVFIADSKGNFEIPNTYRDATIQIQYIGYAQIEIEAGQAGDIRLLADQSQIDSINVVVNTGYQSLPKERAVGSFSQIDNATLNRRVSTNILDRIDGMAPGLFFNGIATAPINNNPASQRELGINIRGESSIQGSVDPLIIVDNFPYEGFLHNLNPNDIESVTILKDASAASIWGARAANGVIVITTKRAKLNEPLRIDFNSNVNIVAKPDIFSNRGYISSQEFIDIESYLFNQGFFDADINNTATMTALSPVVEALANNRAGNLSDSDLQTFLGHLGSQDVRSDYDRFVHRKDFKQQYHLTLSGSSTKNSYLFSVGYDKNTGNKINQGFDRFTLNSNNTYKPFEKLEIVTGIMYSTNTTNNYSLNHLYEGSNGNYGRILPYSSIVDDQGNPYPIPYLLRHQYTSEMDTKGFLDWNLRPLEEMRLQDNQQKVSNILFRVNASYNILPFLSANFIYQNEHQSINGKNHQTIDTYYVRNLINQFSQYNEADNSIDYIFPKGGILNLSNSKWITNNIRGHLNYDHKINNHEIVGLAGLEMREMKSEGSGSVSYGYDDQFGTSTMALNYTDYYQINPSGWAMIPSPYGGVSGHNQRFLSYYFNGSYSYLKRYLLNVSARKDGSNFFGSTANRRFTPLWSAGIGWEVSEEPFYNFEHLSFLKLRASYGYNGNIGNIASQLTGIYTSPFGNERNEYLTNITAPNSDLSWERVKNINIGADFRMKNNRLSGTIEYFFKNGIDLLQPSPLAPQTGFLTYVNNTATTTSNGFDINLRTNNIIHQKFKWSSTLFYSFITDRIVKYDVEPTASSIQRAKVLMVDKPMYSVFSYDWAGLDPENGDPQGYINGEISKDYNAIINNIEPDSLFFHGTSRPKHFGTLLNDFSYKGITLSVGLAFKFDYFFRRNSTSLNYTDLLNQGQYDDYSQRWTQPGDELNTVVPSLTYPANSARNTFYKFSKALVERGDHIRLQDIRVAYHFPRETLSHLKIVNLSVYTYFNNLGILWRANKSNHAPDISTLANGISYALPFSIAAGLSFGF